ncbi:hypothetical protein HMPREF9946_05003 [Acetobacteraceae bacterium AT-5844]|nr:hypothetical protein HMPREF9946_05003 [Acetobacteraceae bacterium AT-5844]
MALGTFPGFAYRLHMNPRFPARLGSPAGHLSCQIQRAPGGARGGADGGRVSAPGAAAVPVFLWHGRAS